ncbi:MAG: SMC family ATPase, partial [Oscillospiraceae bacterium]|nr:SMC family ATPase [Oscillospiraceae bacterium]
RLRAHAEELGVPAGPAEVKKEAAERLSASNGDARRLAEEIKTEEKKTARRAELESLVPGEESGRERLDASVRSRSETVTALTAACGELRKQLDALAGKLRCPDKKSALAERDRLLRGKEDIKKAVAAADEAQKAQKEACSGLGGQIARLTEQLAGAEIPDRATLTGRQTELAARISDVSKRQKDLHSRRTANANALSSLRAKGGELDELEKRQTWVRSLSDTAGGTITGKERIALETYVQTTYFDRVLARANRRLMVMSGNQYELVRRGTGALRGQSGLELDVVDHYNGSERDVRSLSGGESFKASLSLALGLSDEIQSSAGGIKLDTMFVDEGFGSLDEESLRQAINALKGLAESSRLVGIISHVAELKQRIDDQIVVTKDRNGGSRIELRLS